MSHTSREPREAQDGIPISLVSDPSGPGLVPDWPQFMAHYGTFAVNFWLAARDGHLRLVRIEFVTSGGKGEITTDHLRGVEVAKLVAAARSKVAQAVKDLNLAPGEDPPPNWYAMYGSVGRHVQQQDIEQARRLADAAAKLAPPRGRKPYSADHYRQVARDYLELDQAGTRPLMQALAARASAREGHSVPVSTVNTWVRKARLMGFLTRGRVGVRGAEPGPNLDVAEDPTD